MTFIVRLVCGQNFPKSDIFFEIYDKVKKEVIGLAIACHFPTSRRAFP
jgi:hypothetical protein